MLVVLFSVLLLSVIGLGMMYSTNMESAINSNYRDKQSAFYAALAGLQEARDRIQPATHNIVAPTALPSTAAANVIYIVSNLATVKPWLGSNYYRDSELCQEKVLSLTGTAGSPCTASDLPTGTSWFSSVDDSDSSSAPWNLTHPLDLKWVRIQLKANNNTPVAVNGDSTIGAQTCWNGVSQMSTPTGYTTGCQPVGGVTAVMMASSGSGYTSVPMVEFGGGGGTGAVATAVLAPEMTGYVSAIAVTTGGSGYTSAPTVGITGVGSGATAHAVLSMTGTVVTDPGVVIAITLTTGGAGYSTAPTVTLSGGGGVGATATAILSSSGTIVTTGFVDSITLTTGGTGYTSAPTIAFSGGGGSGAAATATLGTTGTVKSIAVSSVGTQCYSQASDVVISFTEGGGSGAAASAVLDTSLSCIYSVNVPGPTPKCNVKLDGFDHQDNVTFAANTSGHGTLYVASADNKSPTGFTVVNPGSGYSTSPIGPTNLQLVSGTWNGSGDCSNLQGTITTGYRISTITVTSGGSGYTTNPTVTITGGTGSTSQPTATVTRGFPVASIALTAGGTAYTSTPTMNISGGDGSGATATAHVTTTNTTVYPVDSVTITAGGSGYATAPTVSFSGGGGSGAAGVASLAQVTHTTYPVESVVVDTGGTGYSAATPPTISFSGGGGSLAAGTPTIATMATGTSYVHHITVNTQGSGYTSNPTVTLTGGGATTVATAISQVSAGTKFGQVWLLTSYAETRSGARSMLQMEVASPVMGYSPGGALTLAGPNPAIDAMPDSMGFMIAGADANSCMETAEANHPAIDGYDDPNASPPTNSVETIEGSLPRPENYTGSGGTPSVENGYASLGETMGTPVGLNAMMSAIYNATGAAHYNSSNASSFNPSSTTTHSITYVDGDLSLSGNAEGNGILVVTGTLTMGGNFSWNGLVFVVGDGSISFAGGGNGQINGSLFVSKIWDNHTDKNLLSSVGSPTVHWNGGGGNGIYYDHCLATNLMAAVPFTPPPSTKPLKVLSLRILPY